VIAHAVIDNVNVPLIYLASKLEIWRVFLQM
jgi:hypothetical protein